MLFVVTFQWVQIIIIFILCVANKQIYGKLCQVYVELWTAIMMNVQYISLLLVIA